MHKEGITKCAVIQKGHVTLSVVVCNSQNYNLNFNSIVHEHAFRRMNRKPVRVQYFNQLYISIKEKCMIVYIHVVFISLYKATCYCQTQVYVMGGSAGHSELL